MKIIIMLYMFFRKQERNEILMNKKNIIIGGAWPYANSSLHLGHIAGLISGDVLALSLIHI